VEKAREEAQKKHEAVVKAQEELNRKQAEWEKKHAEEVKKASDEISKAREKVEQANRRLAEAQNLVTTQMLTFALYGVPQVLTAMTRLMRDSALLTGSLTTVSTQGIGGLIASMTAIPKALTTLFLNPFTATILGVIALILALKYAWDNNLGGIQDKVKGFTDTVGNAWSWLVQTISEIWNEVGKPVFEELAKAFQPVSEALNELWNKYFKPFIDWLQPIITNILKGALYGAILLLVTPFKLLAEAINVTFNAFKTFIDYVSGAINTIKSVFDWLGSLIGRAGQAEQAITNVKPTTEQTTGERGVMQYGGIIQASGLYHLERGEMVLSQSMLSDLMSYSKRYGELTQKGITTMTTARQIEININSPLVKVEGGYIDEKLAKEISKHVLREMRRIVA
jgi:hypothetical protein